MFEILVTTQGYLSSSLRGGFFFEGYEEKFWIQAIVYIVGKKRLFFAPKLGKARGGLEMIGGRERGLYELGSNQWNGHVPRRGFCRKRGEKRRKRKRETLGLAPNTVTLRLSLRAPACIRAATSLARLRLLERAAPR